MPPLDDLIARAFELLGSGDPQTRLAGVGVLEACCDHAPPNERWLGSVLFALSQRRGDPAIAARLAELSARHGDRSQVLPAIAYVAELALAERAYETAAHLFATCLRAGAEVPEESVRAALAAVGEGPAASALAEAMRAGQPSHEACDELFDRAFALLRSAEGRTRAAAVGILEICCEHGPVSPQRLAALFLALREHRADPDLATGLASLCLRHGAPSEAWPVVDAVADLALDERHADTAAELLGIGLRAGADVSEASVRRALEAQPDPFFAGSLVDAWLARHELTPWLEERLRIEPRLMAGLPGEQLIAAHKRVPTATMWREMARIATFTADLELVGAEFGDREPEARRTLAEALATAEGSDAAGIVLWLSRWTRRWESRAGLAERTSSEMLRDAARDAIDRTIRGLRAELARLDAATAAGR